MGADKRLVSRPDRVKVWLAVIALVSPVPAFISDTCYGWRGYNMARWSSRLLRWMFYLTTLVTTDTFAKEVKLFNLGGFFIDRYRLLAQTYYNRQQRLVTARYLAGYLWVRSPPWPAPLPPYTWRCRR